MYCVALPAAEIKEKRPRKNLKTSGRSITHYIVYRVNKQNI